MPWKIEFALKFSLHWNIFIFQGFWGTRACPENKVCHEICRYIQYTFHIQDVWATFDCPEKQSVLWIHCIECTFHHSEFWTTCPCPENRVCPENFHCIEYSFTFRIFEQLVLALKNSVPWIHCIEYIVFIFQNFEQPALVLKNRICPEVFHCIEIFFIFQNFWTTCAFPENRVCPEFFSWGGGPPRLVRHCPWGNLVISNRSRHETQDNKEKYFTWHFKITFWFTSSTSFHQLLSVLSCSISS